MFRWTRNGVRAFPRPLSYAIGHVGTWIAWRLMSALRCAVADNIRPLFPHDSERHLQRRALKTFRSYACDVIDFLRALDADDDDAERMFTVHENDTALFLKLRGDGRGIIIVSGHYGNWEIGGVAMRKRFHMPLSILAMPEASEEVTRIRREIRDALGVETIEVRQSLDTPLKITRQLRDNGIVALLMDRHIDRDRVKVTFLGRTAWFLQTPALMGFLTGAPLVPCFIERAGPGRFAMELGVPIVIARDIPRDDAIQRAAQQFADQLAARVSAQPQYWYQFYPYWKSQPPS